MVAQQSQARLAGQASAWAKADRRAARRKEKEWLSCVVTVGRERMEISGRVREKSAEYF